MISKGKRKHLIKVVQQQAKIQRWRKEKYQSLADYLATTRCHYDNPLRMKY